MNYIAEIKAFNDYLLLNKLSTGEIALWYALMAINNKAGWIKEFTVSNLVLQQLTSLSRSSLDSNRNRLKQRGLIAYRAGTSNQAGKYKIVSLLYNIPDKAQDTDTEKKNEDSYANIIDSYTSDIKLKEAIWGYIQMRINKKSKPTDKALELVLQRLGRLSNIVDKQIEILNKSIINNWTDIFDLKDKVEKNKGGARNTDAGSKKFKSSTGFKQQF